MGRFGYEVRSEDLGGLILEAQQDPRNDSPAMCEIVRRFDALAAKEGRRLTTDRYLRDDLANCARIALMAAVRRHNAEAGSFPAYANIYMRGAAHRELKRKSAWGTGSRYVKVALTNFGDSDEGAAVATTSVHDDAQAWADDVTAAAVSVLTESQQELLRQRYVNDEQLSEIAKRLGTSVSAVSQRLGTAHRALAKLLSEPVGTR